MKSRSQTHRVFLGLTGSLRKGRHRYPITSPPSHLATVNLQPCLLELFRASSSFHGSCRIPSGTTPLKTLNATAPFSSEFPVTKESIQKLPGVTSLASAGGLKSGPRFMNEALLNYGLTLCFRLRRHFARVPFGVGGRNWISMGIAWDLNLVSMKEHMLKVLGELIEDLAARNGN